MSLYRSSAIRARRRIKQTTQEIIVLPAEATRAWHIRLIYAVVAACQEVATELHH